MLIMISPAKSMNCSGKNRVGKRTSPLYITEAGTIAIKMAQLSQEELKKYLKISDQLALSTFERYRDFTLGSTPSKAALLAYTGSVFKEIKAGDFSEEELNYAQNHLRIISVLYGLLRPLDLIKEYRCEYNLKLFGAADGDLYKFWKGKFTDQLIEDVNKSGGVLVNLGSLDLLPAIDTKLLEESVRVVTPEFKCFKNSKWETIRTYAKSARGAMTHFILKNRIKNIEELKTFTYRGYKFNSEVSTANNLIFSE